MAYYNIKRLQIDQHRNWMLRAMVYMSSIITLRLVMVIGAKIITSINSYYRLMRCDEVAFIMDDASRFAESYPTCLTNANYGYIAVQASFKSGSSPEKIGAAFRLTFGMGMWIAILVHVIGVEIYIRLTPAESERLRGVAYEKQLKAGLTPAGSAGLTTDVWGDAVWAPKKSADAESVPLQMLSHDQ
ncbi:uncharacterized protein H6S33_001302 [Morchella sextelata]|uniref:uncharacterized protein n=1 Tax=Morchella sextelata TaxID=1174677 RepID=UPI001D0471E8|nr:uncharacterized protein H6S33_001302 [Morchella sextelata]KAH0609074.1 hypothetical protein H6S33_001302 [Morchella sextelata]